jgi:hypothetical protein
MGLGKADELSGRFIRAQGRIGAGSVTTEEWIEFGQAAFGLFERYQSAGDAADLEDLQRAHYIASAGVESNEGSLKQQFFSLLTVILLVEHRRDTDPTRRAAVAAIARQLCSAYEEIGDQPSLRRVFEVARIWEESAESAGAVEEAAEARNVADRALSRLED